MWSMYYSIYVAFFFSFQNLAFFSELRIIEVSGDEYGVLISTPVVFSGKFVLSSKITDDWGKWWYMYVVLISASVAFFVRSPSMSSNALNGLFYNGAWYLLFGIDKFLCEFRKKMKEKPLHIVYACREGGHMHMRYTPLSLSRFHTWSVGMSKYVIHGFLKGRGQAVRTYYMHPQCMSKNAHSMHIAYIYQSTLWNEICM